MEHPTKLYSKDRLKKNIILKKRLGQYFTGMELARLLASLAKAWNAESIIDPMVGSGDMLAACLELGAQPKRLGAVEIDPIAHNLCSERLPSSHPILGNAFESKTIKALNYGPWELVITNPPYVRYQSLSKGTDDSLRLPSATEVRSGLIDILENLPIPDEEDRRLFKELASAYSGLSDLAVPSWILCAALCAPGGRIALVLPESWLSRDYATIVNYLLLRWFKIEFLVEDAHAAWFSESQIKTMLFIAKRVMRKDSAFNWKNEDTFLKLRIFGQNTDTHGIINCMYPEIQSPEILFAEQANTWLLSKQNANMGLIEAEHVPISTISDNLLRSCLKQKWLKQMEVIKNDSLPSASYVIPTPIFSWLSSFKASPSLRSLDTYGVHVGQGLRTGANDFFYTEALTDFEKETEIISSHILGGVKATVPKNIALPVLWKQADLPKSYIVKAKNLRTRVLALQSYAISEDIDKCKIINRPTYNEMPGQLEKLIRAAELINFSKVGGHRNIWELSAVSPNIRKGDSTNGVPPRFWYMLPDFTSRHQPDLLIARVNSKAPRTFLNENRAAIIDANFSTIWLEEKEGPDAWALLALLNSTWCIAILELSASVMGGGALKVEATHLRRLPVPDFDYNSWKKLSIAGKALVEDKNEEATLDYIDKIIISALLGRVSSNIEIESLRQIAEEASLNRKNHKKSKRDNKTWNTNSI